MTIREVMNQERSALLGESLIKSPLSGEGLMPYAAVTEPDVLVRTPGFLRSMHPVDIEELAARDKKMAFVQICSSLRYKFLWVHADNDEYRADYRLFLKTVHNVTDELPADIHVDHLYNRQRAKQLETPFIRLVLCAQGINTSHGAGFEKRRSSNGLGRPGRDHTMDDIILMKLCGVRSPKKGQPLTSEMMLHVQTVAQLYGMEVDEIIAILTDLAAVADFKPNG